MKYTVLRNCQWRLFFAVRHKSSSLAAQTFDNLPYAVFLQIKTVKKEIENSISNSDANAVCAYTSRVVEVTGLAPVYQRKTI